MRGSYCLTSCSGRPRPALSRGRSSRHSDLTAGQALPGIVPPVYFGLRDHTVYQLTLPRLEAQPSGKNTLSSVWPGSSAIACNFGEGSDFPSDRKQMPKLTYFSRLQNSCGKVKQRESLKLPQEKTALYQGEPNSSKMVNLSPDPYLLK